MLYPLSYEGGEGEAIDTGCQLASSATAWSAPG
jgi:hypothetical protein